MNVQHVRTALRWVAVASSSGAVAGVVYGLRKEHPFGDTALWLAFNAWLALMSLWLFTEVAVSCTDRVVAAMPKARTLVRATLEEMEEQAARDAGLPQIADGQRTR